MHPACFDENTKCLIEIMAGVSARSAFSPAASFSAGVLSDPEAVVPYSALLGRAFQVLDLEIYWWATLESNQARVAPAELQSAAAPCSASPTLRR